MTTENCVPKSNGSLWSSDKKKKWLQNKEEGKKKVRVIIQCHVKQRQPTSICQVGPLSQRHTLAHHSPKKCRQLSANFDSLFYLSSWFSCQLEHATKRWLACSSELFTTDYEETANIYIHFLLKCCLFLCRARTGNLEKTVHNCRHYHTE